MRKLLVLAVFPLLVGGVALADLAIDANLGALTPGVYNLAGDTTGQPNNCDYYSSAIWLESGGEYVYEFSLAGFMTLGLSQNLTGTPDLDQFVLNDLTTTFDGTYNSATSLAFVDESGSFGTFGAGTYYLSVDGYSGAFGLYDMDLTVTEFVPPTPPTSVYMGVAGIDGDLVDMNSFGSDIDTELGLYDELGVLLAQNDDAGGGFQSQILMNLSEGTYYLALGKYNTYFYDGFDAQFSTTAGGNYNVNVNALNETGVYEAGHWFSFDIVPEPASLLLLGLAGVLLRRR